MKGLGHKEETYTHMDKSPRLLSVHKVLFKHEKLFPPISDSLAAID
jgi:hypothetical protein